MRTSGGISTQGAVQTEPYLSTNAAILLGSLCAVWGFGQVASKISVTGYSPIFAVGIRSALSLLIVISWCWVRRIPLLESDRSLLPGIAVGLLFAAEFILLFYAYDYTSVARSIIFLFTMPFFVAGVAHFILPGERLTPLKALGLAVAFAGVLIAFLDRLSLPGPDAWIGDTLAVLAGFFWAATTLTIKATGLRFVSAEKTLAYQLGVSAIVLLPIAPFVEPILRDPNWLATAGLAYQTLFVAASTYLVWFWMVRKYPASILSTFLFLVPVFGLTFGALLGEPVSFRLVLALVCIAIGIALVNRRSET